MTAQLILLTDQKADWRIDDRTKEIGRKGIADARAALRDAARRRVAA